MMNEYDFEEELRYNEYLAEKEYLDTLSDIAFMHEAMDPADMKANIINATKEYIKKIVNGIDLAFKNLTTRIQEKGWETFKTKNIAFLEKERPITIKDPKANDAFPVFKEIDNFITSETAQVTDVNQFSEDNLSEVEFLTTKFRYFSSGNFKFEKYNSKEVSDAVMGNCFELLTNVNNGQGFEIAKSGNTYGKISGDIDEYIGYMDNFKQYADKINNDIGEIKQTTNAFNNLISRIQSSTAPEEPQQNAPSQQAQEAALMLYNEAASFVNYLIEFKSEDAADPEGEQAKKGGGSPERELQRQINKYFKVTTSILSLKMKVANKAYATCFNVCARYARNAMKY